MERITITIENISIPADLMDTPTARQILDLLPLEGIANTWGDEIYFEIPLHIELEPDARAEVEIGELGYWPTGHAFCIFFGPTPMSRGEKPVAASAVNIFGQVEGDCTALRSIPRGAQIIIIKG